MISLFKSLYQKIKSSRPNLSILSYSCNDAEQLLKQIASNKKLGIQNYASSYEDSDILIITGKIYWNSINEIALVLKKIKKDCIIIAYGTCACQKISTANIYIPGCPPSYKNLNTAIMDAKNRLGQ